MNPSFDAEWRLKIQKHTVYRDREQFLTPSCAQALKNLADREIERRVEAATPLIEHLTIENRILHKRLEAVKNERIVSFQKLFDLFSERTKAT